MLVASASNVVIYTFVMSVVVHILFCLLLLSILVGYTTLHGCYFCYCLNLLLMHVAFIIVASIIPIVICIKTTFFSDFCSYLIGYYHVSVVPACVHPTLLPAITTVGSTFLFFSWWHYYALSVKLSNIFSNERLSSIWHMQNISLILYGLIYINFNIKRIRRQLIFITLFINLIKWYNFLYV